MRRAVGYGRRVLSDKPLAHRLAVAKSLHGIADENGVAHFVDFELRFVGAVRKLRDIVDRGEYGSLKYITAEARYKLPLDNVYHWWNDKEKGGGLLYAIGSHLVDLTSFIVNEDIKQVDGETNVLVKERIDSNGEGICFSLINV